MIKQLKEKATQSTSIKKLLIRAIEKNARPRLWVRIMVHPFILKKGKRSSIRRMTRIDIFPYNLCRIGNDSVVESFATLNNGVGDIVIGDHTRIGIGCVVIGPVTLGNHVHLAQNIVLSGLNHNFENPDKNIDAQGTTQKQIHIDNDVWIGANAVITAGVHIGTHCVIAAGSVVTKDIPDYSVAAGTPAKVIKRYDKEKQQWIKL